METQNITLAIPKDILLKGKQIAVQRKTSISKLLIHSLSEIVSQNERYEMARRKHLALLEQGFDLGTEGKSSWTREQLHDRK